MKKQTQYDSETVKDIPMDMASLIASIQEGEKPDSGYFTVEQWAEKLNMNVFTTRIALRKLSKAKKVTKKYWKAKVGDGDIIRKVAYFKEA